MMKFCNGCKEYREYEEFHKDKRTYDGYTNRCKYCRRKYNIKYYQKIKKIPKKTPNNKVCQKCKIKKLKKYFSKSQSSLDGLFAWCKDCTNKNAGDYYKKNKDLLRRKTKKLYREDIRRRFTICKSSAKTRNISFLLTREQYNNIIFSDCYYCKGKNEYFNGIDRLDSSKPYEINNCVSCCSDCNYMKRILSVERFLEQVRKIYENHFCSKKF